MKHITAAALLGLLILGWWASADYGLAVGFALGMVAACPLTLMFAAYRLRQIANAPQIEERITYRVIEDPQ